MMLYFSYSTSIGDITIFQDEDYICRIDFGKTQGEGKKEETPLIKECAKEIHEYLQGKRKKFSVKVIPHGTDFQLKVWDALLEIPYGTTASYKDIAVKIGNEKACRAVGNANNKNPIPIIIPCHRVIGQNGKLVGYAGGLGIKEFLLNLEKKTV